MTEECKNQFLGYLEEVKNDHSRVCLAGVGTVSEIMQVAYNCFVHPSGRSCLTGEEYMRIVNRAAKICSNQKVLVIRGDLIPMSLISEQNDCLKVD